jgi:NTP pyrophosphatase (non-canonical NTP hydrolase)
VPKQLTDLLEFQRQFDLLHEGAVPFYEKITPDSIDALEHLVVCLVGELGEVANIVKKVRRGDMGLESQRADLSEEIADVFIYILKLANQLNVDLEKEYFAKMAKNETRFKGFSVR